MSLQDNVMTAMKEAMKAKDTNALTSLRAIKSAILLAQTESGAKQELSEEDEIKLLQKLVKQRKDSAAIFAEQGRDDLAQPELDQAAVIEQFLPEQLSEEDVSKLVDEVLSELGEVDMSQMGRIIGAVMAKGDGIDGSLVSKLVKEKLS